MATEQKFAWMNNREEDSFVMERLDRAFASVEWVNSYPYYALKNLPIIDSDNGPILLDFEYHVVKSSYMQGYDSTGMKIAYKWFKGCPIDQQTL